MGAGTDEHPVRRGGITDADDFELAAGGSLADRLDPYETMRADFVEQTIQVRQPIRLHSRDIETRPRHGDMQLHPITGKAVGRHRSPHFSIVRESDGLQLSGDRSGLTVPYIVEIAELECEGRARTRVYHEMNVTGRAIRR